MKLYCNLKAFAGNVVMLVKLICTLCMVQCVFCLTTYSDESVINFLEYIASHNVTRSCRNALLEVESYFNDNETIPLQRRHFIEAFTSGPSNTFTNKQLDRWIYRGYGCLRSAGELTLQKSSIPLTYCYAHSVLQKTRSYAVCIPKQCSTHRSLILDKWRERNSLQIDRLDTPRCVQSRRDHEWYQSKTPLAIYFMHLTLVTLVALATAYDMKHDQNRRCSLERVILTFSLKKNLPKLFEMPKSDQLTITCLFGLRFISMCWVLIGHSFAFVQAFMCNVDDFKSDITNNVSNVWIANCTLNVDTFFVISATLTSFNWFHKTRKQPISSIKSLMYWLRYYRHRVVRLWPVYAYTIMASIYYTNLYYHGTWPASDPAIECTKYWWHNLLFINSLVINKCMPWTWYIGTEFIFYFISPIYLITLKKNESFGLTICLCTIVLSTVSTAIGIFRGNHPPTQFFWKQPPIFSGDFIEHHIVMYVKPWYRIGPYIIGLLLGHCLSKHKPSRGGVVSWPWWKTLLIWSVAFLAAMYSVFGVYPSLQGWNWPIYHLIYGTIFRPLFALVISWLIFSCHTGNARVINAILSAKFILPLSNLCYEVYLIHPIFVFFVYLLLPFPMQYTSKWIIYGYCMVQLLLSISFAISSTLLVELPFIDLEKLIFKESKSCSNCTNAIVHHQHIE